MSISNCFSKFYENVIKNELVKSMNVTLSPLILEEWREDPDNNKTVGGILMDLSMAFDYVPAVLIIT